jgi:hypothetical protein
MMHTTKAVYYLQDTFSLVPEVTSLFCLVTKWKTIYLSGLKTKTENDLKYLFMLMGIYVLELIQS